ncbi:MAG: zf-HC2 domain-containing protein [Ilumatobacteraceae bacterium]|jgi:anti-sigma factor (TIGR02949 family)|nr:zf-HC2 domain-containing protein [Ilumatobacteraceae bacterium]
MSWLSTMLRPRPGTPMDCRQVAQLLQHYLDGEVDADRARRIAAHLDDCRHCGLEAETYERIKAALAASQSPLPEDAVDRLREFGEELVRGDPTTP